MYCFVIHKQLEQICIYVYTNTCIHTYIPVFACICTLGVLTENVWVWEP